MLACLPGCSGGTDPEPDGPVETGDAEFGTGTVAFEEVTPGQQLVLVAGNQGGYHFLAHARMRGLDPGDPESPDPAGNPMTSFQVFDADGLRIDLREPPRTLGYRPAEGGRFVLPSARILQITNDAVPGIYDTTVRITLRIEDATGAFATDEVEVVAIPEAE